MDEMLYDVFICHASEDKDSFVRPLACALQENHIEVWYDEFSLAVGDSLRRSIDKGLSRSRFGVVVISPAFIGKEWPKWELDGLVARQMDEQRTLILPIWHNVNNRQVIDFCPPLADKVAVTSQSGLDRVAAALLRVLKPQGSTLVAAKDRLLEIGLPSPVVTDDWWLDIVESSAGNNVEGTFQEAMGWGHWGFPLPPRSEDPMERGERLAWAAAQRHWQQAAAEKRLSQITHPDEVWSFVENQPGLLDTCLDYPTYVAAYAPQVTIEGCGGPLETAFSQWLVRSTAEQQDKRKNKDRCGSALTTNGLVPACEDLIALRHPSLGDYRLGHIASSFVLGNVTGFGPPVRVYETVEYAVWLLSTASKWLPHEIREALKRGMAEWAAWPWHASYNRDHYGYAQFRPGKHCGALYRELQKVGDYGDPALTRVIHSYSWEDMQERLAFSAELLGLPESAEELARMFIGAGYIQGWLAENA